MAKELYIPLLLYTCETKPIHLPRLVAVSWWSTKRLIKKMRVVQAARPPGFHLKLFTFMVAQLTEGQWCCLLMTFCRLHWVHLAHSAMPWGVDGNPTPRTDLHHYCNLCNRLGIAEPELVPTRTMKRIGHQLKLQLSLLALCRIRSHSHIARMLWGPNGKTKSSLFWIKCDWMLPGMRFPGCSQCSQLGTAELELAPIHTTKHTEQHQLQLKVWFAPHKSRRQPRTVGKL